MSTQPSSPRRPRPSRRGIVVLLALTIVGGSSAVASAGHSVTCLINADSSSGAEKGVCLVVPVPDLPSSP